MELAIPWFEALSVGNKVSRQQTKLLPGTTCHQQSSCRPLNYKKRVFGLIVFPIFFFVFDFFLAIVFWTCSRNPTSDQHVSGLDFLTYP